MKIIMSSTAEINTSAAVTAPSFTATSTPGFTGNGSGLTGINPGNISLPDDNYVVITSATGSLTTEQYLSPSRGGTGVDSSAFNGVAVINDGSWSAEQYLSPVNGGTGVNSSAFNGVAKVNAGVWSASSIVDADISPTANISDTKLAIIATPGQVANSATTATSSNVANAIVARDSNGNIVVNDITASEVIVTSGAIGQSSIQSGSFTTSNANVSNIFSLITSSGGIHGTNYLIYCNISLGNSTEGQDTGIYQFVVKAKNVGGTVTVSSPINIVSILDNTLSGTTVSTVIVATTVHIQITGLAATAIQWFGQFTVVQVNF